MAIRSPNRQGQRRTQIRSHPGFAIYPGAYYQTKIKGDEKRYHFQKWKMVEAAGIEAEQVT
jgi:hypothetical protein